MIVSNNSILNILLPNDNKVLKEVLKEADSKTLENLKNSNKNISDVLKNLFSDLKSGNKSNATIENMLKNSNLFKDLGNFTNSTKTLLNNVQSDSSLAKYKTALEGFLKDISTVDEKSLKNLITKSGVFQEAKILNSSNSQTNLPKNLEQLLGQIKTLLKDIPNIDTKNIQTLIDKIIQNNNKTGTGVSSTQNNNDLKSLVNLLQNLSKNIPDKQVSNLTNLTNQLKTISLDAQLIESKISNTPNNQTLSVLNQIKQELQPLLSQTNIKNLDNAIDKLVQNRLNLSQVNTTTNQEVKTLTTNIDNLLKNLPSQQSSNLTSLNNQLKTIIQNSINEAQKNNPTQNLTDIKNEVLTKTKDILFQLKNELLTNKNIDNNQSVIKQIDKLLLNDNLFSKNQELIEPKNLLNQLVNLNELKTAASQNPTILNSINSLKNLSDNIEGIESKILSNQPVVQEKAELTQKIKDNLSSLKSELQNIKTIDTKVANQIIDKLLNIQNLFSKIELPIDLKNIQQAISNQTSNLSNFQNLFSSNIDNLILNLKEAIVNSSNNPSNLNLQQTVIKTVEKLENILNNLPLNTNTNLEAKQNPQSTMQNDMKTLLLQMQDELASKTDPKSIETLKHIDKMVTHLEYFQLLSLSTNSNSVYVPFFWDMLEDGNISMKKLKEDRFFCEINLNLKEFGQTQLMLSMYDKNKLDLTIHASKESFKQAIKENFSKLRVALNSAELIPVNIKIIDLKKEKEETPEVKQQAAYNQDNSNLGLGINIKA